MDETNFLLYFRIHSLISSHLPLTLSAPSPLAAARVKERETSRKQIRVELGQ